VVIILVLYSGCGSYDQDDSPFIPVQVPAPVHLRSYCASLHICTLSWRISSGPCDSLMPYIIRCMRFAICTFPRAFPTTLTVERALLPYPRLLFMLILHGNWWLSVRQSYPAWVLRACCYALRCPPRCDLPCLSCLHGLLSLVGCNLF